MKFSLRFLSLICFLARLTQPGQCLTKQVVFRREEHKYLPNHVIESRQAEDELMCAMDCVGHDSCASANYKVSGTHKGLCELNSEISQEKLRDQEQTKLVYDYNHLYVFKKVSKFKSYSFFMSYN